MIPVRYKFFQRLIAFFFLLLLSLGFVFIYFSLIKIKPPDWFVDLYHMLFVFMFFLGFLFFLKNFINARK